MLSRHKVFYPKPKIIITTAQSRAEMKEQKEKEDFKKAYGIIENYINKDSR